MEAPRIILQAGGSTAFQAGQSVGAVVAIALMLLIRGFYVLVKFPGLGALGVG
jgi:hypothetical protein